MMFRVVRRVAPALLAFVVTGCANKSPTSPDASVTASVTAPRPGQPAANTVVRFGDQPITLTIQNAALTRTNGTTYSFEVATDVNFSTKVQTKDGVPEGSNGQTTLQLDSLAGGRDYFWHARASGGGTTGPFSPTAKFSVGPAIIISPPVPIGPLNGTTTSPRPAFRVTNATRTGPAGAISYFFEISTSSAFTPVIMNGTNSEGVNETGFIPNADLPTGTTLYWRATAIDASNGVTSNASAVQSFTARALTQAEQLAAQLGQPLWPGNVPPGSPGHATMGNDPAYGQGWQVQTLYYAPGNVSFQSPDIEMLRYFDLFDRGFDPGSAIAWMNSNGYPSSAAWYPPPDKAVLGLRYVYLAARGKVFTNGTWDVVLRVE